MKISTNPTSMTAQRMMKNTSGNQERVLGQLSSGNRILNSAVDPAGLAISEKLKANIRSTSMAKRNANDGISMVQVADGSLNVMSQMSIRMRELAMQAANDTLSGSERSMVNVEFQQLKSEMNRVIDSTEYNGKKLLSGKGGKYDFQVGITASKNNTIAYDIEKSIDELSSLGLSSANIRTKVSSQNAMMKMDVVLEKISSSRASLGSIHGRMNASIQNLGISEENLSAANSQIRDTDIAKAASEKAKLGIISQANAVTLAQTNDLPKSALRLIG